MKDSLRIEGYRDETKYDRKNIAFKAKEVDLK